MTKFCKIKCALLTLVMLCAGLVFAQNSEDISFNANEQAGNWINNLNDQQRNAFGKLYEPGAIIFHNGTLLRTTPYDFWSNRLMEEGGEPCSMINSVQFVDQSSVAYVVSHLSIQSTQYAVFSVFERIDRQWIRKLDWVEEIQSKSTNIHVINATRLEWMKLCNAHMVEELIENKYADSCFYFNRGRLIQGRHNLLEEYGYMKNPDYQLKLQPEYLSAVNDSVIYEIGQCSGSYGGKYVLIWHKISSGQWQIAFDTNY